jgi:hypothetical protein
MRPLICLNGLQPKDLMTLLEDVGPGKGAGAAGLEQQQDRYPHRGAGATPVMSSHVLEAIQDAVADFFARVSGTLARGQGCRLHCVEDTMVQRHAMDGACQF